MPDEITLGISISGCQVRCKGCNQRELWEDKGEELNVKSLEKLLEEHKGVTCICFFGGEHSIDELSELMAYVHYHACLKTAWYCGLDMIPKDKMGIIEYLDFLKIGHYDEELGGLDSPTTNQRLYKIEHLHVKVDITSKLQ